MMEWSKESILQNMLNNTLENDMLGEVDSLEKIMEKLRKEKLRREILENHNHKIYFCKSNGRWMSRLGKHKPYSWATGKTKMEAEDAIVQYYLSLQESGITFEKCFEDWVKKEATCDNPSICAKTITNYRAIYKRYLSDKTCCKKKILDITESDLRHLFNDIVENTPGKIERKRLSEIKSLFTGVYNHARMSLDLDVLHVKPILSDITFKTSQLKTPSYQHKQQIYLQNDLRKLCTYMLHENTLISLGILLVAQTGLRQGEIAAMSWENVYDDYLDICQAEQSWTSVSENGEHKRSVIVGHPKGYKYRKVYLSAEAKDTIRHIRMLHPTQSGFLFLNRKGERATCRMFDYHIRKYCRLCEIPELSMHKLRKTYASVLLAIGLPAKVVQEQLGHNDFSTTINHYQFNPFGNDEKATIFSNTSALLTPVNTQ